MDTGTGLHTFELVDARGDAHKYLVAEHPAGEGMAIMFELLGLGAPSVLSLAGAALASEDLVRAILEAMSSEAPELGATQLGKMLGKVDLSTVAAEVGRALGTGKAPALTRQVLARTHRDGKPLNGVTFEAAYQANYAELLQAIWKVCQINRFFPLPSTSAGSPTGPGGTLVAIPSPAA